MSALPGIVSVMLSTAPGVAAMRGKPGHRDWARQLAAFSATESLAPLRPVLEALGQDALTTMVPLNRFLGTEAAKLDLNLFRRASEAAEAATDAQPCAAFVLGFVALLGWAEALGDRLQSQDGGMPHPGWMRLPYVVANAGFRLGSNAQSLALVEQASGVLGAAKYLFNAQLRHALDDYRKLAGRIHRRTAGAIADLAEDLRTASQAGPADFRAEIGAMLWTLGYGPESRLLRPEHAGTPPLSRRFYRRVVAQSLAAMPHDPLLQYIWLAMKDRPAFNLRDHGELFARINLRYSETILDQALPEPPSQVFAATCIGWFRGNLDREAVQDYLGACELVAAQYPHCDWLVLLRMEALARPLARQFGFLLPEAVAEGDTTFWLRLATLAADLRRTNGLHPEWPAIGSRASVGSFQAIDALADTAAALDVVERSREAALAYWLATIPPLPTATEQEAAGLLLKAEQEKLVWLRGAYFLVLTPVLPIHYRRYGMELREMLDRKRDPLDPDTGRTQFKEIRGELSKLHDDMQQLAPAYAGRRKNPRPSLTELSGILAAHAVG